MKKRIFTLLLLLFVLLLFGGYRIVKERAKTDLILNARLASFTETADTAKKSLTDFFENNLNKIKKIYRKVLRLPEFSTGSQEVEQTVIHLKQGGTIAGKILKRGFKKYIIEWKGQEIAIATDQIKSVEKATKKEVEWPYENDVVVKRTNGVVLDGKIIDADENAVTLRYLEGGGSLELEVNRSDIECLLFAPVYNRKSQEIESQLRIQFPKMEFYTEGNVTIITDSHYSTVKSYKRAIKNSYTDIYLKFFKLFRGKKPRVQNFVVIFDDFKDFAEYAITDGVPFWAVLGYFSPTTDVLYLFNAFGERIEKMVFDVIVSKTGKSIDEITDVIKERVDERYHMRIEGMAEQAKDKYQAAYSMYRHYLTESTISTLRHEFAHEIFHNWGLQNIIMSKPNINRKRLAEKKKEFLETDDCNKKEALLLELIQMKRESIEDIEMEAAQSWLAEGTATYCETNPVGSRINERWLFAYQELVRKKETTPIEFLMVFKMGSFPGLAHKGMINSYAQSWAFTTFLMNKYPAEFIEYQIKLAEQKPKNDDEELAWLLEATGKKLDILEKEFRTYMDEYEKIEDPYIRRFMQWREIWENIY